MTGSNGVTRASPGPEPEQRPPGRRSGRLAGGYFLGFAAFAVVVMLWYRGLLRPLLPVLLLVGIALVVLRVIKAIKAPVD